MDATLDPVDALYEIADRHGFTERPDGYPTCPPWPCEWLRRPADGRWVRICIDYPTLADMGFDNEPPVREEPAAAPGLLLDDNEGLYGTEEITDWDAPVASDAEVAAMNQEFEARFPESVA